MGTVIGSHKRGRDRSWEISDNRLLRNKLREQMFDQRDCNLIYEADSSGNSERIGHVTLLGRNLCRNSPLFFYIAIWIHKNPNQKATTMLL